MPDRVTVTSRTGWTTRLAESIKSVLFGMALFLVGFPVLFWNEGRAVRTARSLEEGAGVVVSVSADAVDPVNEGRLVHLNGQARTDDILEDDQFGISENAVHLIREVEMYQWVESQSSRTEKKIGGGEETVTTYEYSEEWREELVDSDDFESPEGHRNPRAFPYEARTLSASSVSLGAFTLSPGQIDEIQKSEPLALTEISPYLDGGAKLEEGALYFGEDSVDPAVGDVRVRFRVVRPSAVSIVARQIGSTFEPYHAEAGGTVFLLQESIASAETMFEAAQRANTFTTWLVRGGGFFLMFLGIVLLFQPIAVFGDVIPLVGTLLRAGVGVFALFAAAFFAFVTAGIAWFVYRPVLAIGLLLGAAIAGAALLAVVVRRPRRSAVPPPPPVPQRAS